MSIFPTRRKLMSYAAAGCLALGIQTSARAADDIVIGASMPLTSAFGFAGIPLNLGFQDYVKIANDAGGIGSRKIKYISEDSGYAVDKSIAAFNRITASEKVSLYYGDSTGFSKTINAELNRRDSILMAGENVETSCTDDMDCDETRKINPVLVSQERKHHQPCEQQQQHHALHIGIQKRLCLGISFVGGAYTHQSRSISIVPNNP